MVRSTEEPSTIEIQHTEKADNGFLVDLLIHWKAQQITVDDIDGESHQEWEYEEEKMSMVYQGDPNELNNHLTNHKQELLMRAKAKAGKLTQSEKDNLSYPKLDPSATYTCIIDELDANNQPRAIRVKKLDREIYAWCYYTSSVKREFDAGNLSPGDHVLVSFSDEKLDRPVVQNKVEGL